MNGIWRLPEGKYERNGRSQELSLHLCFQNIKEKLEAELQEAQSKMKAVERKGKEELERFQKEIHLLLQYREALQNQVSERAVGTAVVQQVVSALLAFPLQHSSWWG